MMTTLAPPPSSARSVSPTHESEGWPFGSVPEPNGAIVELRREVQLQHRPRETYIEPRRHFWLLDAQRRDAVLSSEAAYLVCVGISMVLTYVMAHFAALWMYGPVS